jgi:hypothetical protein
MKDVYAIYESRSDGRERSRWVRVGVAFDNRDGSVNVLLDALPLSGRLQIRTRPNDSAAEPPEGGSSSARVASRQEVAPTPPERAAETRTGG